MVFASACRGPSRRPRGCRKSNAQTVAQRLDGAAESNEDENRASKILQELNEVCWRKMAASSVMQEQIDLVACGRLGQKALSQGTG